MNSVEGGWWVAEARKPSATGGRLGPGGSKTPTWWSTEPVVRCRIVEIGPFQRRRLGLARPESAFPRVGKSRAFAQPESSFPQVDKSRAFAQPKFMRAQLVLLTTNYRLCFYSPKTAR